MTRWFEDIAVDEIFPLGSHDFTEAEIIRFGQLYDPQYFHVDPDAARHSHFGGLVASGWHTVSVGHRRSKSGITSSMLRPSRWRKASIVIAGSPIWSACADACHFPHWLIR